MGLGRLVGVLGVFGLAHTWVYIFYFDSGFLYKTLYFFVHFFSQVFLIRIPNLFWFLEVVVKGLYHIDGGREAPQKCGS